MVSGNHVSLTAQAYYNLVEFTPLLTAFVSAYFALSAVDFLTPRLLMAFLLSKMFPFKVHLYALNFDSSICHTGDSVWILTTSPPVCEITPVYALLAGKDGHFLGSALRPGGKTYWFIFETPVLCRTQLKNIVITWSNQLIQSIDQ